MSTVVECFATENQITLFWEKTAEIPSKAEYQVLIDEEVCGTIDKTHYTIKKLEAETEYRILVKIITKISGEMEEQILGEVTSVTTSIKEKIDITKSPYYAVGDGKTLNTAAIQKAINDCRPNQRVYIPAGVFLTGALRMHSDMELYVEKDGVLKGTENPDDYLPRIWSRFEGTEMECYSSLLNIGELDHTAGYVCKNVVIQGEGTIESGGGVLAKRIIESERERLADYIASLGDEILTYENSNTIPGRVRPRLINMSNAQNVRISGLDLKNGASWNVHMIYSDNIVTNNCRIYSENVWNGDGWDPDSSTNCTLFDCKFYTGDDAVAIKSGKNSEGNKINKPCEHIRIFDCTSSIGHGIVIGSEMSGGVSDVKIWDCDMGCSMNGIEIKGTKKRGGYVRGLYVRDTTVARILMHSVGYNDDGIGADKPPVFENCTFENLHILGKYLEKDGNILPCKAIELCGFDEKGHYIKNVTFRDVQITGDINLAYCESIHFENVHQLS